MDWAETPATLARARAEQPVTFAGPEGRVAGIFTPAALKAGDSPAVMKIVALCEEEFDIAIPDEELIPDNFESVRTLARLVERIKSAQ